jgi:hypothetical protein
VGSVQAIRVWWQARKQAQYLAHAARFEQEFGFPVSNLVDEDLERGKEARMTVRHQLNSLSAQVLVMWIAVQQPVSASEEKQARAFQVRQLRQTIRQYRNCRKAAVPFANDLRLTKIPDQVSFRNQGWMPLEETGAP